MMPGLERRATTDVAPRAGAEPFPEIVCLTKSNGPLTKRIRLDENGVLHSDGSACVMSHGGARRVSDYVHRTTR